MEKLFPIIIGLLFLFSCSNGLKESGTIKVENGLGRKIEIPYSISSFDEFIKKYSKEDFNFFMNESLIEAKNVCTNKESFIPQKFTLYLFENDTINATLYFTEKNNDRIPVEMNIMLDFKEKKLIRVLPPMEKIYEKINKDVEEYINSLK